MLGFIRDGPTFTHRISTTQWILCSLMGTNNVCILSHVTLLGVNGNGLHSHVTLVAYGNFSHVTLKNIGNYCLGHVFHDMVGVL